MNEQRHPLPDPARTLIVHTTVGSAGDARRIARDLVERRLAACAQVEPIESFYVWDGALQHESEQRIAFKTTAAAWPALRRALLRVHPYELPEIVALECAGAHAPYARWVAQGVSVPDDGEDERGGDDDGGADSAADAGTGGAAPR
jgi:periplasmic divalent cation tolerance protein